MSAKLKVLTYDVSLTLDQSKKNFTGRVELEIDGNLLTKNDSELVEIRLHSADLIITSGLVNKEKVSVKYYRESQQIGFTVDEKLIGDEPVTVELQYIGKLVRISTYQDTTQGLFITNYLDPVSGVADRYVIASNSQPSNARRIFPCLDEIEFKSTIQLTVTMDKRFHGASNMAIESEKIDGEKICVKFEKSPQMSVSMFAVVCGDLEYSEDSTMVNGQQVTLRGYNLLGYDIKRCVEIIKAYLPVVSWKFGSEFPLRKLDLVGIPFLTDGAVENWGLITVQQDILFGSSGMAIKQLTQVLVHELVHQWLGNLVTFDSWKHYWLNESFATYFTLAILNDHNSTYNLEYKQSWINQAHQLDEVFEQDEDTVSISHVVDNVPLKVTSIESTFNAHCYNKGIHLLRMYFYLLEKPTVMVGEMIDTFKYQCISPIEYWKSFDPEKVNFIVSWIRLPGYPIVSVTRKADQVVVTQHRYFTHEEPFEDYVYQIPLFITFRDARTKSIILTERELVIEEPVLTVNTDRAGYFRAQYDGYHYEQMAEHVGKFTELSLIGVFLDIEETLATKYASETTLKGFFTLADQCTTSTNSVLLIILRIIQTLKGSNISQSEYQKKLLLIITRIYKHLEWPDHWTHKSFTDTEMQVRNLVLILGVDDEDIQNTAKILFRRLLHGPRHSIPRQLLVGTLVNYLYNCDLKSFKKLFQLTTQACGPLVLNINNSASPEIPASIDDIRNAAVGSLGYSRDVQVLTKVLNYIATNIDMKGIEIALAGFNCSESSKHKEKVWHWFTLHFDQWASRSLQQGSEYSAQLHTTLENIVTIVASNFNSSLDRKKVDEFIASKHEKYPNHGLKDLVQQVRSRQKNLV